MSVPASPTPHLSEALTASKLRMGVVPVLPAHPCPLPSIVTFHCPVAPWEEVPVPTTALPWRCAGWPWRALRRDAGGRGAEQVTAGLDGVVSEVDEVVSKRRGQGYTAGGEGDPGIGRYPETAVPAKMLLALAIGGVWG